MITTLIFDLDDTLYCERQYCHSGFKAIAKQLEKQSHLTAEELYGYMANLFENGHYDKIFNKTLDFAQIDHNNQTIREFVKLYRNHTPHLELPSDSREVLEILHKKYQLALLTDGFLPAQQLKVEALGIEKYFRCIIYTESLGRNNWKPSTVGFEKILQTLGQDAQNSVYIADNEQKDFIGPNKLNMLTIKLVTDGQIHTDASDEDYAKPAKIINDITQLPEILQTIT